MTLLQLVVMGAVSGAVLGAVFGAANAALTYIIFFDGWWY